MSLLNSKIVRPLELGVHSIQLVGFAESLATNGNEFITISFKADGEDVVRSKALFAVELNLMTVGVSGQLGYEGTDVGELLNLLKTTPFQVWLVQKEAKGMVYTNWWYSKPESKAPVVTAEAPADEQV